MSKSLDKTAPRSMGKSSAREVAKEPRNIEQQGQQGNTYINTHHKGYQQDR